MDYKYIFIDEVSMMSEAFYKFFLLVKSLRPDINFIISGDFAQLLPVADRLDDANYKDSLALNELVDGNRLILSKCRRSDDKLYKMLLPDNINYLKKEDFGNNTSKINICFTNKKRIEINNLKMTRAIKNSHISTSKILKLDKLDYDDNSQYVELVAGMPIIARKNSKQFNICNNETFKIHQVRHKTKTIVIRDEFADEFVAETELIKISFDQFQHMFYLAYCITTHKSQGMTIDQPYCIHEFEKFDERMKYVALSRSTDILNINIV
jgi:ATP-dependent exoDNAse (exonuclease V) alpha subunit